MPDYNSLNNISSNLKVEIKDNILIVALNRPEKRNTINDEAILSLEKVILANRSEYVEMIYKNPVAYKGILSDAFLENEVVENGLKKIILSRLYTFGFMKITMRQGVFMKKWAVRM